MREPRPIIIAFVVDENLRLVLQPPEGRAVDDAVTIALERQPKAVLGLVVHPPPGIGGAGGVTGERLRLTA